MESELMTLWKEGGEKDEGSEREEETYVSIFLVLSIPTQVRTFLGLPHCGSH